jgi:hypothetical protein
LRVASGIAAAIANRPSAYDHIENEVASTCRFTTADLENISAIVYSERLLPSVAN